ncbi:MAG: hypothetical protein IK018_11500 [Lachnospiraceae bacterium]|nr:hypothetical protein [Lachnospiraceae bacterium]
MINQITKIDEKTYLIESDMTINEDIFITDKETLIIRGSDTKVYIGTEKKVTIRIDGALDNHGRLMLINCTMHLGGYAFRNYGVLMITNRSKFVMGYRVKPRMLNAGMIYIKDNAEFKHDGESEETELENAGMIQVADGGRLFLSQKRSSTVHNSGVMRLSDEKNFMLENAEDFRNDGIVKISNENGGTEGE